MGKDFDADSLLAHVNTDKDTHKDIYKDKDNKRRKLPRRKSLHIGYGTDFLQNCHQFW